MYFNYSGAWTGGHDVMGFSFAANLTVVEGTGIRKFVDSLPGLGAANANNLGQYIPVAIPDTTTFPGSDYYEIGWATTPSSSTRDLPPTNLRGYRQTNTTDPTVSVFHYLGPIIVAEKDVPVRVKFTNKLPTGAAGDLFIPVDTTLWARAWARTASDPCTRRTAPTLHLHGGVTPVDQRRHAAPVDHPGRRDHRLPEGRQRGYVPTCVDATGT